MHQIAIFASGNGSNAQRIAEYFQNRDTARVALILSNNPGAFVLKRADLLGIPAKVFNREMFYSSEQVLEWLKEKNVDFIALAGFLWLVPAYLIKAYPKKIVNIHPALLPKYGGAGMYGDAVHKAVLAAGESESGITIHYVNEFYDQGPIIFQAKCPVKKEDTPDTLAQRVHQLEYQYYPVIIEKILTGEIT